ncbi:MAG: hypothetical protein AAGJ93_00195, partial [Bacteroidota bacterium]
MLLALGNTRFVQKITAKAKATFLRLWQVITLLPTRFQRLGKHLLQFCWTNKTWWLSLPYFILDILAVPEVYETLADWIKWNTRPLTRSEIALLDPLFGNSIDYWRVRIDERAFLGPPQLHICYVSFYTINAWRPMRPDLLIHEAVHVWQFQQMGSVYIPLALQAQFSKEGYNYGGAPRVVNWARRSARLLDFNLEQQADLVADYWRLQYDLPPHWGPAGQADLPFYAYFVDQLQ